MMANTNLLLMAALATVSAVVYLYVAHVLGRRPVDGEAKGAHTAFRGWWALLAVSTLLGTVTVDLLVAFDLVALPTVLAVRYVNLALICGALAGLLYYLVFLYSGRHSAWMPIALFYGGYFTVLMWFLASSHPVGVEVGRYTAQISYETPLESRPLWGPMVLLLVGPQILASLAYLLLVLRVRDRTQRYRIVLVSVAILVWFGSALIGAVMGWSSTAWWPVTSRVIGMMAALAVLAAYRPPGFVQRRLRVEPLLEEDAVANEPPSASNKAFPVAARAA